MSRRPPRSSLRDRVVLVVLVVAVLAVLARLLALGSRVAHQDEARVGYWTLRFLASGRWEYRPIVHGPFIPIVTRHLFTLLGPSDFVARLPMAILGGSMPAMALLFRDRLRDSETVALAVLLAANPVLLYYSRFMRQDLPLAALALLTFGLAVRAYDADGRARRRYTYAAGLAFGLAATTKENVLLYPVAWGGALALVVDYRLLTSEDPVAAVRQLVPDPPHPAIGLPVEIRLVAPAVFLATAPPVAAVLGVDGTGLAVALAVSAAGYYGAVHGGTVWHLVAGLPLAGIALLAFVRPVFDPGLTIFAAGVAWILAGLALVDERVFDYALSPRGGRPVETDGGEPDDETTGGDSDNDGPNAPTAASNPGSSAGTNGGRSGRLRERLTPLPPLAMAYILALAVVVVFYAPRGGGYPDIGADLQGWGLWSALSAGSVEGLATVVRAATYDTWIDFLGQWGGNAQDHPYIPFFLDFLKTLRAGALTVTLAALAGTLYDRYGEGPRPFVAFCAYWGFASVFGYPLVTDIAAPWATVHAVVALVVPAAVALAAVYRVGRNELAASETRTDGSGSGSEPGSDSGSISARESVDFVKVGAAAVILLAAGAQVGWAATEGVYLADESRDNELVQYAQPASPEMKAVLGDIRRVARQNEGVDVLYYGDEFYSIDESDHDQPPAGQGWFGRLPLAYYTEMYRAAGVDVVVNSTTEPEAVRRSDAPVVVSFAPGENTRVPYSSDDIAQFLEPYSRYNGHRFLYDSGVRSSIVYFVDTGGLDRPATVYGSSRSSPALSAR